MIYAIIDIGSNTVRMAVYDIQGEKFEFLMKKKYLVGLAAYLDHNKMTQAGIDKVCEILHDFKSFLDIFGVKQVAAFTTAALRNCTNSKEAVAEIIRRTGIKVEVLSGDEEAEYDFQGATRTIIDTSGILVDIGGASTELVAFKDKKITDKISLPMGSLAFRTQYASSVWPNKFELKLMQEKARKLLAQAKNFAQLKCEALVGIGGTFKGTAALYNAMYNQETENTLIMTKHLKSMIDHFVGLEKIGHEDALLLMKHVPDRVNMIVPGMIIADTLASHFWCKRITYSDSGVREGFIYTHLV